MKRKSEEVLNKKAQTMYLEIVKIQKRLAVALIIVMKKSNATKSKTVSTMIVKGKDRYRIKTIVVKVIKLN